MGGPLGRCSLPTLPHLMGDQLNLNEDEAGSRCAKDTAAGGRKPEKGFK